MTEQEFNVHGLDNNEVVENLVYVVSELLGWKFIESCLYGMNFCEDSGIPRTAYDIGATCNTYEDCE